MQFTARYHVTATEKKTIKTILDHADVATFTDEKGVISAGTKRKFYVMTPNETGYDVVCSTPEMSDTGKRQVRTNRITVVL